MVTEPSSSINARNSSSSFSEALSIESKLPKDDVSSERSERCSNERDGGPG